jgi:hypothetical protein
MSIFGSTLDSSYLVRVQYACFTPIPISADPHLETLILSCRLTEHTEECIATLPGVHIKEIASEIYWYLSKVSTCAVSLLKSHPNVLVTIKKWAHESPSSVRINCSGALIGLAWPIENRDLFMKDAFRY